MRPLRIAGLGDGDKVCAVEDGRDALDIEELRGQWGWVRRSESRARGEILQEGGGEIFGQDAVVGDEFQSLQNWWSIS